MTSYTPVRVLSVFVAWWAVLCFVLCLVISFAEPSRAQESWDSVVDYRTVVCKASKKPKLPTRQRVEIAKTTVLWRVKQSALFLPRYVRFVAADLGLRESAYLAWNADYLNAREKGYFEVWCW